MIDLRQLAPRPKRSPKIRHPVCHVCGGETSDWRTTCVEHSPYAVALGELVERYERGEPELLERDALAEMFTGPKVVVRGAEAYRRLERRGLAFREGRTWALAPGVAERFAAGEWPAEKPNPKKEAPVAKTQWTILTAEELRQFVEESEMSRSELGRRAGVSAGAAKNWLDGKAPKRETQEKLRALIDEWDGPSAEESPKALSGEEVAELLAPIGEEGVEVLQQENALRRIGAAMKLEVERDEEPLAQIVRRRAARWLRRVADRVQGAA